MRAVSRIVDVTINTAAKAPWIATRATNSLIADYRWAAWPGALPSNVSEAAASLVEPCWR